MKSLEPRLIVALDNCDAGQARGLVEELSGSGVEWFKVGLELYTQTGPSFVTELKKRGHKVFLDLKLHDIPNTVGQAVKAAAQSGADLLTVHCSGGVPMLESAEKAARSSALSIVGVTVLTSLGGRDYAAVCEAWGARSGESVPRGSTALRLAELACLSGLDGVVCSASDLHDGVLRRLAWNKVPPLFVTPGIRDSAAEKNDQASVAPPEQAVLAGSTHLVIGRPITGAAEGGRAEAAKRFLKRIRDTYGEGRVLAPHS